MKLLSLLSTLPLSQAWLHRADVSEAPLGAGGTVDVAPDTEDDLACGCGWFDSSHELRHGLQVTEHDSADAVANDLPVQAWLTLHLACGPSGSALAALRR